MKSLFRNTLARPGAIIAFAVAALSGGAAHAAGTLSGTSISNLATLSYSVGGTAQTSIGSSAGGNTAGAGTATSFVVDNKVNLSVLETGGAVTSVVPGTTNQVTTFTITNSGNTAQGYTFAAANQSAASAVIAGTADSIDVSNFRVFVDANGNGNSHAGAGCQRHGICVGRYSGWRNQRPASQCHPDRHHHYDWHRYRCRRNSRCRYGRGGHRVCRCGNS